MVILVTLTRSIRSIFPSFPVTTTQPFSTVTRLTVLMDRLINVPSFVSITKRGPTSGSGSAGVAGAGLTGRAVVPLRTVFVRRGGFVLGVVATAGSADVCLGSSVGLVSSLCFAVSSTDGVGVGFGADAVDRRPAGRRVLALAGGVVLVVFFALVFGAGDSAGVATGVGLGVGATTASVTGGAGSSIRAPTELTRFP